MLKASELKDKASEELEAMLIDLRKDLFASVNEAKQTKRIDKPHLVKQKRKDIARILTVMREKKRQATKQ
ncbi:50S ribosomal protein L29 [Criblamydia sequanensis]|uniref:Large ribosomal subunit protein uL29 n=1 Tax=Candidatus Criblamydia sequanensis CRIB-18 TaxID=1437425 RepID=A0A090CY16_9BACT|nr:50S ribosomal protein L29 [Criblamydia sequanensis]CDR33061.1 50S ribosomal protein L29 [Criblamydia sequanensis CRIB-18]